MADIHYNPDVLTCLANLSNDEVFTPPDIANQMLDLLPQSLWQNPDARFLDPVCKSGVFLREIAKRLIDGLATQIPDLQERLDHIFGKQLYGIAITEMTALLSRRSVYCAKSANSPYAICTVFDHEQGNICYRRLPHRWENGKCQDCGASQEVYDHDNNERENHAYAFIHGDWQRKLFNGATMKFDVIIGNPPYQLSDGGGTGSSAKPLYHLFVQQAKRLNPDYLIMIIQSRWFSGGKGLDSFRDEMLSDNRVKIIVDYINADECFPGADISGGVSYFLWDKNYSGDCLVQAIENGICVSEMQRPLKEEGADVFIRFNQAISIIRKIYKYQEISFSELVFPRKPFGLASSYKGKSKNTGTLIELYSSKGISYIDKIDILNNSTIVGKFKIFISKAYGERISSNFWVLGKPFLGRPNTACTETYLVIGPFDDEKTCNNVMSYICTRFFRFLVLLKKILRIVLHPHINLSLCKTSANPGQMKNSTPNTASPKQKLPLSKKWYVPWCWMMMTIHQTDNGCDSGITKSWLRCSACHKS